MANAVIVTLRDNVRDDLNVAGRWSQQFTAVALYQPKFDFEKTKNLQVQVVPLTWNKQADSRSEWSHDYVIGIGINYRADPSAGDPADFDRFLRLVEEISDYYEDTRPTTADCSLQSVSFGGAGGEPYAHELIEELNQFTSVIQLTFRKWR